MKTGFAIFLVLAFFSSGLSAQDTADYYDSGFLRYENFVYKSTIKTVVFEQEDVRLSEPVLELGGNQKLVLSFDDLEGDFKNYYYTLIHCDANWNPSGLLENEYLQGFTDDRISEYRTSFNTIQKYTHYSLVIPGREVRPTISGNYLVKIFVEGEPDKPVLTARMLVVQPRVAIEATVRRATIVSEMNSKQEIDFSILYNGLQIANPFEDIKVVLMQNGRWDNALTGLKPLFLKNNKLEYHYEEGNTFTGGNEFRTFDLRTLRTQTQFVKEIISSPQGYTVVVTPDLSRSFGRYVVENDINGKFLIRNQDGRDSEIESEYVNVKFTLKHELLVNGNFYVFGALTGWRMSNENKMTFNEDEQVYQALLYLKQGYYDYEYVFLEDGKKIADETVVEGSHYETTNFYDVLVYYRALGGRYDQLVGIKRLNAP